jgi:hypothetical protein
VATGSATTGIPSGALVASTGISAVAADSSGALVSSGLPGVSVAGASGGGVLSSAYTVLGLMALKAKTAMMTNERKDERVLPDIDPPWEKQ